MRDLKHFKRKILTPYSEFSEVSFPVDKNLTQYLYDTVTQIFTEENIIRKIVIVV